MRRRGVMHGGAWRHSYRNAARGSIFDALLLGHQTAASSSRIPAATAANVATSSEPSKFDRLDGDGSGWLVPVIGPNENLVLVVFASGTPHFARVPRKGTG